MGIKPCLAGLCLAVLAATVIDVPPVEAQTYTAQRDRPINRPRARITVEPRSFLDAGTEVLPGERKFTDYAFPAGPHAWRGPFVRRRSWKLRWLARCLNAALATTMRRRSMCQWCKALRFRQSEWDHTRFAQTLKPCRK